MASNKVKGYIFRHYLGTYYLSPGSGVTELKREAYIYSMLEATTYGAGRHDSWGRKAQGKWQVVYE